MRTALLNVLTLATVVGLWMGTAKASYLEACDFTATVKSIHSAAELGGTVSEFTRTAVLEITEAVNKGSHSPLACAKRVGEIEVLTIAPNLMVQEGSVLSLGYFHVNSLGPDGVVYRETWEVL